MKPLLTLRDRLFIVAAFVCGGLIFTIELASETWRDTKRFSATLGALLLAFAVVTPACNSSELAAQRTAADAVGKASNTVILPILDAAYERAARGAVDVAATPDEAEANMATIRQRWAKLWDAWDALSAAQGAWATTIESKGDTVQTATAAREAYCALWKLGPDYDVHLPQFPGVPCQ